MSAAVSLRMEGVSVQLAILTSKGPSVILGLRALDARLGRSTVCLDGMTTQAGIAADYNAFVRMPTGVIERLFGKPAWRMDVSSAIDAGQSWQLGALAAHALHAAGRLHVPLDNKDAPQPGLLLLLTGTIRSVDLAVGQVGELESKTDRALTLIAAARAKGQQVLIAMPAGNLADVAPATRAAAEALGAGLIELDHIDGLFARLALAPVVLEAEAASGPQPQRWTGSPYRGLEPFAGEHRAIFFGRARAREEVMELLRTSAVRGLPFLLVHGRSGAGKSSLLAAGVAGDVMAHAAEGGRWSVLSLRLGMAGQGALAALTEGLARALQIDPADIAANPAAGAARALARGPAGRHSLLLILDQLEQPLATEPPETLLPFAAAVRALARSGQVWVIAAMRTDQMEGLDRAPDLAWLARDGRSYRLDPPTLYELTEIVLQPAAAAGLRFASGPGGESLPEKLAEIALRSPDSLPLLQMVLSRLATQADGAGVIPFAAYERLGGFEAAIGRAAEEVAEGLIAAGLPEAQLQRLLSGLVRIDPTTGRGLARSLAMPTGQQAARAIDAFVAARIVTPEGSGAVRLSHEALILHWPRLTALTAELRDDLLLRDQIEDQAVQWLAGGRSDEDLLTAPLRLSRAEDLSVRGFTPLDADAGDWLAASRARAEREAAARRAAEGHRRQRDRRVQVVLAAATVLSLGLFAWSLTQTWEAQAARAEADKQLSIATELRGIAWEEGRKATEQAARAETAQAAASRSTAETASVTARVLAESGRQIEALAGLTSALTNLPPAEWPPAAADSLLMTLQEAAPIKRVGQLPEAARLIDRYGELWVHEHGAARLSRLDAAGEVQTLSLPGLAAEEISDLRLLPGSGDLVILWATGLVERWPATGAGRFDPPSSAQLIPPLPPPDPNGFTVVVAMPWSGVISPDGLVLATESYGLRVYDERDATLMQVGRPDKGGFKPVVVPETARHWAALPTEGGFDLLDLWSEQVNRIGPDARVAARPITDADLLSVCLDPAAGFRFADPLIAGVAAALRPDLMDYTVSPLDGVDCLALRSGVLVQPFANAGGVTAERGAVFVTQLGAKINLLDALATFLPPSDQAASRSDQITRAVGDAESGLIVLAVPGNLVALRIDQQAAAAVIVAQVPYAGPPPVLHMLGDGQVLVVDPTDGRFLIRQIVARVEPAWLLSQPVREANPASLPAQFTNSCNSYFPSAAPEPVDEAATVTTGCEDKGADQRAVYLDEQLWFWTPPMMEWQKVTTEVALDAQMLADGSILALHPKDGSLRRWRLLGKDWTSVTLGTGFGNAVHLSADEQGNHVWISGYISGYTNSSDQEVYLYSTALKQRLLTIGPFGPNGVLRAEFLTDGRFVLLVNRETAGLIGLDAAEPDITLPETEWEMGTEFVLRSYRLPSSTDMLQRARSHSPI